MLAEIERIINTDLVLDEEEDIVPWTATYVRTEHDFNGNAAVYEMNPPHCGYRQVVVSAVNSDWAYETYIFGIELSGEINWTELNGSAKGTTSHVQVLSSIGYVVK